MRRVLVGVLCVIALAGCGRSQPAATPEPTPEETFAPFEEETPQPSISPEVTLAPSPARAASTRTATPKATAKAATPTATGATAAPSGAPSGTPTPVPSPATHTLSRSDSGKTEPMRKGDTLVVNLEENPGTGYHWEWETGGRPNEAILKITGDQYIPPSSGSPPGAAGTHRYTFEAAGVGATSFKLEYRPPDPSATPAPGDRFTLSVNVS